PWRRTKNRKRSAGPRSARAIPTTASASARPARASSPPATGAAATSRSAWTPPAALTPARTSRRAARPTCAPSGAGWIRRSADPAAVRRGRHAAARAGSGGAGPAARSTGPRRSPGLACGGRMAPARDSGLEAVEQSPQRSLVERLEAAVVVAEAPGAVERDQAVRMRPERHRDVPRVALAQHAARLCVHHRVVDHVERGRTTGAEVLREAAGVVASYRERVVEQVRMRQRIVEVDHLARDKLRYRIAARLARGAEAGDLLEAVVADAPEQRVAAGEVAVDRHRGDPDRLGHAPHGDRPGPFAFEQGARGCEDAPGGGRAAHVYTVYCGRVPGATAPRVGRFPPAVAGARLAGPAPPAHTFRLHSHVFLELPWPAPATTRPARSARRAAPPCTAAAGSPRRRTGCCRTTSIRTWPSDRRTWWCTAASAAPRATGPASTPSSPPCARSAMTRPCWCSRASRWACSRPIPTRRGC